MRSTFNAITLRTTTTAQATSVRRHSGRYARTNVSQQRSPLDTFDNDEQAIIIASGCPFSISMMLPSRSTFPTGAKWRRLVTSVASAVSSGPEKVSRKSLPQYCDAAMPMKSVAAATLSEEFLIRKLS